MHKLILTCLALHDKQQGQHSSNPTIAVSNVKIAAKNALDERANDSLYLEAVAAAIVSDCTSCQALKAKKAATAADMAQSMSRWTYQGAHTQAAANRAGNEKSHATVVPLNFRF